MPSSRTTSGIGAGQAVLDIPAGAAEGAVAEDLSRPLREVTFVVVDLETTGGSPADSAITEIGAVKVRGGVVLGEFQTLVRPRLPIPPFVALLTGITDAMVATAPPLAAALPAFLEFAHDCVLVAHNAGFDMGFLRAACAETGSDWPGHTVIDTVHLARQVVTPDEAPNRRLGTLAQLFCAGTVPDHRALHDARATVDVLHALLGRIGSQGVTTLGELRSYSATVPVSTRRKRSLADDVPHGPGVYMFRDAGGRVLYVGTSVDVRTRVRSYFTRSEQRSRMRQMVALAHDVVTVPCGSALEAGVRELRLIAEHAPPFNRRGRSPERRSWLKLTDEPFPRLSVVRDVRADGTCYLGPFSSTGQAELAAGALHEAHALRRCGGRLPRRARSGASACLLAEIGRCPAPCVGGIDVEGYAALVADARRSMLQDAEPVVSAALRRIDRSARDGRYEEAGAHRDRMAAFLSGATRVQRLAPMAASPEIVAARRQERGGWEVIVVRHGRLAGTCLTPPGADPMPAIAAVRDTAEVVAPPPAPLPAALPAETELVLAWLEQPGTRLVSMDGEWSSPRSGALAAKARLLGAGPGSGAGPEGLRSVSPLRRRWR